MSCLPINFFSPPPYFATAPCFDLPRIFGPFLTRHIFTLFPGQLRAGSEKGGGRMVTWWRSRNWHRQSKNKIVPLPNHFQSALFVVQFYDYKTKLPLNEHCSNSQDHPIHVLKQACNIKTMWLMSKLLASPLCKCWHFRLLRTSIHDMEKWHWPAFTSLAMFETVDLHTNWNMATTKKLLTMVWKGWFCNVHANSEEDSELEYNFGKIARFSLSWGSGNDTWWCSLQW